MVEYAFPKDLLGGIKDRWNVVPAGHGFELPPEPMLLEICYHASLRTDERRPVHCAEQLRDVIQALIDAIITPPEG